MEMNIRIKSFERFFVLPNFYSSRFSVEDGTSIAKLLAVNEIPDLIHHAMQALHILGIGRRLSVLRADDKEPFSREIIQLLLDNEYITTNEPTIGPDTYYRLTAAGRILYVLHDEFADED